MIDFYIIVTVANVEGVESFETQRIMIFNYLNYLTILDVDVVSCLLIVLSMLHCLCLCSLQSDADKLSCLACHAVSHILCLARHFLSQCEQQEHGFLLPINGSCPSCNADLLWGDLIRYKRGCYQKLSDAQVIVLNLSLIHI